MFLNILALNIIEEEVARLTGESRDFAPNLDAIVEEIRAGKSEDVKNASDRLNDARALANRSELLRYAFDNFCYVSVRARNTEAHEGVERNFAGELMVQFVEKLEKLATFKVGKNFDYVAKFAELDRMFNDLCYQNYVNRHDNTLGRTTIFWAMNGAISKRDAAFLWKWNNLRNKHVHTGKALTKAEREFVETIPARAKAIVAKVAAI